MDEKVLGLLTEMLKELGNPEQGELSRIIAESTVSIVTEMQKCSSNCEKELRRQRRQQDKKNNEQMEALRGQMQEQLDDKDAELQQKKQEIDRQNQELEQLRSGQTEENRNLQNKVAECEKRCQELEASNKALADDKEQLEQDLSKKNAKLHDLEEELQKQQQEIDRQNRELEQLRSDLNEAKQNLQEEAAEWKEAYQGLEVSNKALTDEKNQRTQQLTETQAKLSQTEAELGQKEAELGQKEVQLQQKSDAIRELNDQVAGFLNIREATKDYQTLLDAFLKSESMEKLRESNGISDSEFGTLLRFIEQLCGDDFLLAKKVCEAMKEFAEQRYGEEGEEGDFRLTEKDQSLIQKINAYYKKVDKSVKEDVLILPDTNLFDSDLMVAINLSNDSRQPRSLDYVCTPYFLRPGKSYPASQHKARVIVRY